MSEISTKPYLIRAIHQWCSDQGLTPYLSVVVDHRTLVPRQFVQDGQIVLNVSTDATQSLVMGNEMIAFQARFGGVARDLYVPIGAVTAIYARENGAGMAFDPDLESSESDNAPAPEASSRDDDTPPPPPRPKLQRIK